jgi:hypothetical protein
LSATEDKAFPSLAFASQDRRRAAKQNRSPASSEHHHGHAIGANNYYKLERQFCVFSMKLNWDDVLSELVASRLKSLLSDLSVPSRFRDAAKITNALPVLRGVDCQFCIRSGGAVLCYDEDAGMISLADDNWSITAAVCAVDKYPELIRMLHKRHSTAKECSACSGAGELPSNMKGEDLTRFAEKTGFNFRILCGTCRGLGWIE